MNKYETFWLRLAAGIIDSIVLFPVSLLINLTLIFPGSAANLIIVFLIQFLTYSYYVLSHWRSGRTIGKRLMGIRVVHKSEDRLLTLRQAFMRDSVWIVIETFAAILLVFAVVYDTEYIFSAEVIDEIIDLTFVVWFLLELITMFTNTRRRAVHDFLADSVVIKEIYWNKSPYRSYSPDDILQR